MSSTLPKLASEAPEQSRDSLISGRLQDWTAEEGTSSTPPARSRAARTPLTSRHSASRSGDPRTSRSSLSAISTAVSSASCSMQAGHRARQIRAAIALMPAQASPPPRASFPSRLLAWSVSSTTKGHLKTASCEELGLEARGLLRTLAHEVRRSTLKREALGPNEPVCSAVKVRSEALRVFERAPATPHRDREAWKATLERALDLNQSRVLLRPAQVVENYHNPHRGLRRNCNGNRDRNTVRGVGHGVATDRPGDRPRALHTLPKALVQVESPETTRHTLEVAGTRLQQPIPVLKGSG